MRQPVSDRGLAEASFAAPCRAALGASKTGYVDRASRILSLLGFRFPAAVVLGVWTVVVLSPEGEFTPGSLSHVGKEITESVFTAPPLANENSAPAIVLVASVVRVRASGVDTAPRPEFNGPLPVCGVSVSHVRDLNRLIVETSARLGMPIAKMPDADDGILSAVAPTQPECQVPAAMVNFSGYEPAVTLAGEIKEFRHNAVDLILSRCENEAGRLTTAMKELFGVSPYPATGILAA